MSRCAAVCDLKNSKKVKKRRILVPFCRQISINTCRGTAKAGLGISRGKASSRKQRGPPVRSVAQPIFHRSLGGTPGGFDNGEICEASKHFTETEAPFRLQ